MAKKLNRFEDLLTSEILSKVPDDATGTVPETLKEAVRKMIDVMNRIADDNESCRIASDTDHENLVKMLTEYNDTQSGNKKLIESVRALTNTRAQPPAVNATVNLTDDVIDRIEKRVRKSKPIIHIDFNKTRVYVMGMVIAAICESAVGYLSCAMGTLTPAERLAIVEYRAATELGYDEAATSYDKVMKEYDSEREYTASRVKADRKRMMAMRKLRASLSTEYSGKLHERYPDGLVVKNAWTKTVKDVGQYLYMYCTDMRTATNFSLYVTPIGDIYLCEDTDQKEYDEITDKSLKTKWRRI